MIFYFSGTGNSKYVAKKIAQETSDVVYSITEAIQNDKYTYTTRPGERIGFVSTSMLSANSKVTAARMTPSAVTVRKPPEQDANFDTPPVITLALPVATDAM